MDGTSGVTQCPITPNSSFQYVFNADIAGTYWYHSHLGKYIDFKLLQNNLYPKATNIVTDFEELWLFTISMTLIRIFMTVRIIYDSMTLADTKIISS